MVTQPSVEELIGALPGVAFLLDQADRVLHANAAAAALLGRPEDAVRDAIEGAGAPAALLAAARTARAGTRTVVVVALADGAPCECTAMAVGTGAVLIVGHAVSASSEVTGRWQPAPTAAEAQLLQLQAPGTVGRLVSDVAHDFNNLLTAVLGESEIALARSHEADTVLGLKNIRTAALQGRRLTAQLLAFARQEKLQVETVEVAELLAVMTPLLTRLLGEDVGLAIACAPDLWPVRVEPTQIEQVLMNLAVNARNAMPDGGHLEIS
ncbi:MAG TPA: histidine kinase dimerization/phospho-acceptor domain-containing protein, partial [Planctomycetota bacterium]|nr:histidine kinase dimerization/phospho-acceptor domain-containing protein [Planctomycetota bacterium]